MRVICAATVLQGLIPGFAMTSMYELLVEITYPRSDMFVSLLGMGALGVFRLLYPIVNRLLLNTAGPTASALFPLAVLFFVTLVSVLTKMEYKRQQANEENSHLLKYWHDGKLPRVIFWCCLSGSLLLAVSEH